MEVRNGLENLLAPVHGEVMQRMQRIGEIGLMKKLVREAKANVITPAKQKLLEAASVIRLDPAHSDSAFMARHLVQCTLPHSDPGDVEQWARRNGNLTLGIQRGWDFEKDRPIGHPYGVIPRLLLFWITTEAVRTKNRRLELGNNLSAFMRELGLIPSSAGAGKRSDATRLREQVRRLFSAHISFRITTTEAQRRGEKWLNMDVAPEGELWWDPKRPEQGTLWGSWIVLGEKFFQAIVESPVPLDTRALKALKRSPLALDLYAWASYKSWIVNKHNASQFVPWQGLMEQLGSDYDPKRIDHFKDKVKATLRKVSTVFPGGLYLKWQRSGLTFLPGTPPAVGPRRKKRATP
jgi:hypothetical protein